MPLLWVSAGNDHFFGPQLVSRLTGAFSKAGGKLTLVQTARLATMDICSLAQTALPSGGRSSTSWYEANTSCFVTR